MKKYLAFIVVISAFVYSCTKTSHGPATITGTWRITADSIRNYVNGTVAGAYADIYGNGITLQFSANGSGFSHNDTVPGNLTFTYTMANGKVVFNYPAQRYGNTTPGATIDTARIGLLTNNKLELIYTGFYFNLNTANGYYEQDVYLSR